jgi:hypothetical protein
VFTTLNQEKPMTQQEYPVVPHSPDLPQDNDDELTLAQKRAQRAQKDTLWMHGEVRTVGMLLQMPHSTIAN